MSKKQGMYIGILKREINVLKGDKEALEYALQELGYCSEQQANFITSMSSEGICKDQLLAESKAALAEAVATNKRLTDDLEFQEHRYRVQGERLKQTGKACRDLEDTRNHLTKRLKLVKRVGYVALALAMGQALQNAGLIKPFINLF